MREKLYNTVNKDILKHKVYNTPTQRVTLSFYKYWPIINVPFFRDHLYARLFSTTTLGRIYVASEGVNAQVSVPNDQIDNFKKELDDIDFLKDVHLNFAIEDDGKSFYKLKIKIRDKIVADGIDDQSFNSANSGTHLDAKAFNKMMEREEAIVIDMRNHYESEVGHFEGAICPDVETFKESLPVITEMFSDNKHQPILMYCTGGIRCEKASAYLKHHGFEDVYQLEGGIIEYSRQSDQMGLDNKFKGKNFVFDDRLGERISPDIISLCHQCGTASDKHVNCANDACHILFIQCEDCGRTYEDCCSTKCAQFNKLDEEKKKELRKSIEFNGTRFGKGRYKAHHKDEHLVI